MTLSFAQKPEVAAACAEGPGAALPAPSSERERCEIAAIKEAVDLLEADLIMMIREVAREAEAVSQGVKAAAAGLGAIRSRTETLADKARGAHRDAADLAEASAGLSRSSDDIGRRVGDAGAMTDDAATAAAAAGRSVEGLRASSSEIGNVVGLIATIAKQGRQAGAKAQGPPGHLPASDRNRRPPRDRPLALRPGRNRARAVGCTARTYG